MGSLLGPLWALIKPLFTLFILWFAFDIGLRSDGNVHGFPRFVFLLVGYVPWFFISESNIMTFTALSRLYVHIVLCVLMYITLIILGYCPSVYNLQFFYYVVVMFVFFLALSWTTATFSAISRDFENLVNSIMTGLFWLSGVFWDTYGVKSDVLKVVMYFNPINYFVNGYRKSFLYDEFIFNSNYTTETIVFFAEFIVIVLLGAHNYKKLRKTLPDIL